MPNAEASSDLSWWKKFFNPTFDLDAQRFELSPLSSFLLEHPEFLLSPASLARHAVKTVACAALQRVAPKLLAASGAALAWENFVSFMKGGKDAVKKTTAGDPKTRVVREQGSGDFWDKLITGKTDPSLRPLRKKSNSKMEVRFDGKYYYQFDKMHKIQEVHLHRYERVGKKVRPIEEVDPETGRVIAKIVKPIEETWF